MNDVLFAFSLTLLAGLSTGIGSTIAFFSRKQDPRYLSVLLGFSAGVMIYVSMIEIFPKANDALVAELGNKQGAWATVASFFAGIAVIALIDRLVPKEANPHDLAHATQPMDEAARNKLKRMGTFTAIAIANHNFPEGFATFISALQDPTIAVPIAVAIALHNIPEGIAVSAPIYYATKSRTKAFWLSFASGLAEPLGALIGYLLGRPLVGEALFGIFVRQSSGSMPPLASMSTSIS